MKALIGNRLLASLKPADKPFEIRDTKLQGFILRVQPSGVMSYIVEYGRGKRITLSKVGVLTPAQARDRATEILADVVRGADPLAAKKATKAHTLESFVKDVYGPWVLTHQKRGQETLEKLRKFAELDSRSLPDITPWLVEKYRAARFKTGIKPTTVNRDIATLKAALAKAVEWKLLQSHPLAGLKLSRVDHSPKIRFLTPDEECRLRTALGAREERIRKERDSANAWRRERGYDSLPDLRTLDFVDHLKPMVLLSINTGVRRGELFSLTWDHVDLNRALLTVEGGTAKSGKTRHLPLNAEALAVLKDWRAQTTDTSALVFPGKDGDRLHNVKSAWNNLMREAGITGFRWHDMRHHFASRLVMAGVDLNTVRELLGHSDIKMTLRYAHLAPEHKAAAVARLVPAAVVGSTKPAERETGT